ncbi:MAG: hypothetical protein V4574_14360 [Pseudomonadota bacterium]
MRSWGKIALGLVTAVTLFVAASDPAEARRRFRFGVMPSFGGSSSFEEKIDKVYDLPDNATYSNDGKYYDLGSFYQIRDGAEMHGPKPVFVLYSGDRYVRLDDAQLAILTEDLGMDPTAVFRAKYAANVPPVAKSPNEIERREGETSEQFRARVRAMAGAHGKPAAATAPGASASGGPGFGGYLVVLLLGIVIVFAARKFMGKRLAAAMTEDEEPGPDRVRTRSFDQRVAERLREVQGDAGPTLSPAAAPAGVRTFGRRIA